VWVIALVACALAGCGRYGFCAGPGATPDVPDNQARPNVVFVTSMAVPPTFGTDLSGGDKACADAATAGGWPGTFVAWLSSPQKNAIDRLSGSRGWVRPDGVPVVDAPSDLVAGKMFNPINVDENKVTTVVDEPVWTGTDTDGRDSFDCNAWTSTSMNDSGVAGSPGNAYPGYTISGAAFMCQNVASLYCFEVGHTMPVAPTPATSGRTVFLGRPRASTDLSPGALDSICQSDANNNNVSGNFLAAVAYGSTTIASRFTLDAQPWHRIDGTTVTTSAARLFDQGPPTSFINQTADGAYVQGYDDFWSGTSDPYGLPNGSNCSDWSLFASTMSGLTGRASYLGTDRWHVGGNPCDTGLFILCLEQ
jgi:hypothetical protein